MKQYIVTGMSCAACSARVEKAVSSVPGVESCSVSLLTNSMGVEGDAPDEAVIQAVTDAGYGAFPKDSASAAGNDRSRTAEYDEMFKDRETPVLKRRLAASLMILVPLMYISMGTVMFGWPAPSFFENDPVAAGMFQMLAAGLVMIINQRFFINGTKGILHGSANMDTLVSMGSGASFLYSVYVLFTMSGLMSRGDHASAHALLHDLYFESSAMILTLITVGKMLEAHSKGKTTDALKDLIRLSPETARLVKDGVESVVPAAMIKRGDIFAVRPGDSIPADGTVTEGSSAVNESALTGESIPVYKVPGDKVSAATVNITGYIRCRAEEVGEDTALSKIIKLVSDAAATKAPIARIADRVSGIFVPSVTVIAAATVIIWLICGAGPGFAVGRGISVLVISCPCALGLATPVAIMVGNGVAARHGVLFKTSAALENAGRTKIMALDKTGTITKGEPAVTDIVPAEGTDRKELLFMAAALEKHSEHPLASAVMKKADEEGISAPEVTDFMITPGGGLTAFLDGTKLTGGNSVFIASEGIIPSQELLKAAGELSGQGKTPLFFARDGECAGMIAAADEIKEDSAEAVGELRELGVDVVMITGDNRLTADAVGKNVGISRVIAGVLPGEKAGIIEKLKSEGSTAMTGDGINDAPALTAADTGIAIGAGTDIAIDAAGVVLLKSTLRDAAGAVRIGKATLRIIHQNLFWAFFYNVIGIPVAAGVFYPAFGWKLSPMLGAAAMSLSSFCVVSNALRLNMMDFYGKNNKKGEKKMSRMLKVSGMMCEHCEARVKKDLEALDGVERAEVSHVKGTAEVFFRDGAEVADDVLKKAVEADGYTVDNI